LFLIFNSNQDIFFFIGELDIIGFLDKWNLSCNFYYHCYDANQLRERSVEVVIIW